MARFRVLAVQLNRLTRDTMKERRSDDREVEYLEQGTIVDDFTDAEVKRYTAGTHPAIVEVDDDGNPVEPIVELAAPMPTVPQRPVDPNNATELDIDAVAAGQAGVDGEPIDPTIDAGKIVTDKTSPAGGLDQQPTDVRPHKAAKAAAKTVTRGGVRAGNVSEKDSEDAPDFS